MTDTWRQERDMQYTESTPLTTTPTVTHGKDKVRPRRKRVIHDPESDYEPNRDIIIVSAKCIHDI